MRKILISWIAYSHDFKKNSSEGNKVNEHGTHCEFYRHLFNYNMHLLLSGSSEDRPDTKFRFLINHLKTTYGKNTLPEYMNIEDVVSIEEIKSKLYPLLHKYTDEDVEIFVSPGTPAMQTCWYLLAMEFKNVRLFHVRPPKFRNGEPPKKEYIKVQNSGLTNGLIIHENHKRNPYKKGRFVFTPSIQKVFDIAEKIADTDNVTTFISGESGTGKEVLARHIHEQSRRAKYRFIAIDCGSWTDNIIESKLFGHVKGAFSGATDDSKGAFIEAHQGTLFLDEIGNTSKRLQRALLRVIQEREISPLGAPGTVKKVDVRIIAATHENLLDLVNQEKFRADLFFRLMVADIRTLTFRELPKKEKTMIINFFLDKKSRLFDKEKLVLSKEAKNCLLQYVFPGNIRELENLIERMYVYCEKTVALEEIPNRIRFPEGSIGSLRLLDIENKHIKTVLNMYNCNKRKTSEVLGISYTTLNTRIEKFDLECTRLNR
ncbi:MAG: sigma 54-interacting transcriptional regulator [Bacteroidota bacterium]